ncbi:MAG: LOG family protein [Anaerolineae bacterium]|nr:LOG family protein [Anaerolineae bacterium]
MTSTRTVVTVFGASVTRRTDPDYAVAEHLGELLAQSGYAVMTGGYFGMMEAVSKGAKSAGGHVIGVTVSRFEGPDRRSGPNIYNDEVIPYDTLRARLLHLVDHCDAAIALPGGIGTLSEVALMWSFLQVDEIKRKPFVLLGDFWVDVLTGLYGQGQYIKEDYLGLWQPAQTPEEAVKLLDEWKRGIQ